MDNLRKQIDQIDENLLSLLKERLKISKKVGIYKKANNLPIYQAKREKEILSSLDNYGKIILKHVLEISCYSQVKHKYDKHIVLIGLPACGKSTMAKKLGKLLDMQVCEMDKELMAKKTMEKYGEKAFRGKEAKLLVDLVNRPSMVVSTGGGSVVNEEAMSKLKEKSIIFYINRSINDIKKFLKTDKRPIFKQKTLEQIYNERKDLYEKFADYQVKNERQILNILIGKEVKT